MNAQDKHPAPGTDPQPTPTAALADEPSGFVGDIEQEMDSQNALRSENSFSDLTPIYVSHSGHARLFSARRYGKLHTLKCLKEDFLLSPTYRQALAKEFDIGIQLDHPSLHAHRPREAAVISVRGIGKQAQYPAAAPAPTGPHAVLPAAGRAGGHQPATAQSAPSPGQENRADVQKKTLQALHKTEKGSTFAPQTKQDRGIAQLV